MITMLRFLSLSSGLKLKSTPWPTRKESSLTSVTTTACHGNIAQKTNKTKTKVAVECSFLMWPPGVAGVSPAVLREQDGGQRWLYGLTWIGHLHMQTALSFSKHAVFTQNSNFTGRWECPCSNQRTDAFPGDQRALSLSLSVMSLDQLHCECLRGTRSSERCCTSVSV